MSCLLLESSSVMKSSFFGFTSQQQWKVSRLYGIMLNRISLFCSFSSHKHKLYIHVLTTVLVGSLWVFYANCTRLVHATTSCSYLHHSINAYVHMKNNLSIDRGVKCAAYVCVCVYYWNMTVCMFSAAYKFGNCKKGNWRWKRENTEHT